MKFWVLLRDLVLSNIDSVSIWPQIDPSKWKRVAFGCSPEISFLVVNRSQQVEACCIWVLSSDLVLSSEYLASDRSQQVEACCIWVLLRDLVLSNIDSVNRSQQVEACCIWVLSRDLVLSSEYLASDRSQQVEACCIWVLLRDLVLSNIDSVSIWPQIDPSKWKAYCFLVLSRDLVLSNIDSCTRCTKTIKIQCTNKMQIGLELSHYCSCTYCCNMTIYQDQQNADWARTQSLLFLFLLLQHDHKRYQCTRCTKTINIQCTNKMQIWLELSHYLFLYLLLQHDHKMCQCTRCTKTINSAKAV
ncbi:hypothetical protein J6590_016768 [Homalodisca vitripennis]|nr:hypothetical protein J6590_016768 [Homalodisca vitripennis]